MKRLVCMFGLAGLLFAVLYGNVAAQTSVTLTFWSPLGERAPVTRAQLLVTAWGVAEKYELQVESNVVRVDLEATRPEFAEKIADASGFIYIKAAGYAPLMSQAFTWPAREVPAVIDFRNGRSVTVPQGTEARLEVTLRRPVPRRIRLLDNHGQA